MSITRKLMTAAGGGEPTYVDDVFSTYLYEGNGEPQREVKTGLQIGNAGYGTSTSFDGTTDALVKNSDLTGNVDGKQFTFSAWVRPEAGADGTIYGAFNGPTHEFVVDYNEANERFSVGAAGGNTFAWQTTNGTCPVGNWYHILVSADLTDPTNKRHLYVNDVSNEQFNITNNLTINFAQSFHSIARGTRHLGGSMAHVYLDYTYRDMSIEANRRIFNDGASSSTSSASLAALSPILYVPLVDANTANLGTGGSFTEEGSPSPSDTGVEVGEGKGGLVWIKERSQDRFHFLYDTERGAGKWLNTNNSDVEATLSTEQLKSFNSDGFTLGDFYGVNDTGEDFVSWSFAKQEGFFDVLTYTGNGVAGREIPHNLGSTPGMIIVKSTTRVDSWAVYHRSLGNQYSMRLDRDVVKNQDIRFWNYTDPTDAAFTIGTDAQVNSSGEEYVAYVFAHDVQEFGPDGDESIIKCGSYTGTGADDNEVDLGWEPQWVLVKNADSATGWYIQDSLRGLGAGQATQRWLLANDSLIEGGPGRNLQITPNGFKLNQDGSGFNGSGDNYIYMAIRRPHKPAEEFEPDELFSPATGSGTAGVVHGFPVDMAWYKSRTQANSGGILTSRMTYEKYLDTSTTSAAVANASHPYDRMDGYGMSIPSQYSSWGFKRAPGFFDVVTWAGDAQQGRQIPHNLGAAPEMIWVKKTTGADNWLVYTTEIPSSETLLFALNESSSPSVDNPSSRAWGDTFTEDVFSVGQDGGTNGSFEDYIACLWASVPGICDIGSYTGDGSARVVDCGFTNGARFVLIKRTDSTGNWMYFDTLRGIGPNDDPFLNLNLSTAQTTNRDFLSANPVGFEVNGPSIADLVNTTGAEYIYMAIA